MPFFSSKYCHIIVEKSFQKKAGPWDLINSYKTELVEKPCPPCKVPIPISCFGGHEVSFIS